jgi:hypothetical protein
MRRFASIFLIMLLMFAFNTVARADEILFRNLPWGSTLTSVTETTGFKFTKIHGESYKTYSVDAVLHGDYDGLKFEYTDINLIANVRSPSKEQNVAGFTTSDMVLYFAYIPDDGTMVYEDDHTALYGARYIFEPTDIDGMAADLMRKLSSLYGEPTKKSSDSDWMNNKYVHTYWEGDNNTVVVLREQHADSTSTLYHDEIQIGYAWRNGDIMLQDASDTIKAALSSLESDNYGSNDTSGL